MYMYVIATTLYMYNNIHVTHVCVDVLICSLSKLSTCTKLYACSPTYSISQKKRFQYRSVLMGKTVITVPFRFRFHNLTVLPFVHLSVLPFTVSSIYFLNKFFNNKATVLHPKRIQNALFHSMWIFSAILQAKHTYMYNISS